MVDKDKASVLPVNDASSAREAATSMASMIKQQLHSKPKPFLRVRGQHNQRGLSDPVTDFDIWIDCTSALIAGPVEAQLHKLFKPRKVVVPIEENEAIDDDASTMSVLSICDEALEVSPAEMHPRFETDVEDVAEQVVQDLVQQSAAIARYLGTVTATMETSKWHQDIVSRAPYNAGDDQPRNMIVTFDRKWTIDWGPIAGIPRSPHSGRASLPSHPNLGQRDPSNVSWRTKLPKAMLAGHIGQLGLDSALPTDGKSIMQAAGEKGDEERRIAYEHREEDFTFRKIQLPSWGGNQ